MAEAMHGRKVDDLMNRYEAGAGRNVVELRTLVEEMDEWRRIRRACRHIWPDDDVLLEIDAFVIKINRLFPLSRRWSKRFVEYENGIYTSCGRT